MSRAGGGLYEPFNSDIGALLPIAVCVIFQSDKTSRAWARELNGVSFNSLSRNRPLNDEGIMLRLGGGKVVPCGEMRPMTAMKMEPLRVRR